ncbi:MAG: glycosyltransferase family 2 protein [Bacilli bacterium]|nr:glycosyltransferase family 2 protein [Bacilli bacterium]
MKNNKVSIIIPVYNCSKFLKKLIDSLKNQTYKNFEVIFINDGSKDNSLSILKKVDDERFIIIDQKNQGVAVARNNGLKRAKGEYITFVDSDDYIGPKYLEYLVTNIEKYSVDLCVMGFQKFTDNYKVYESYNLKLKEYLLENSNDYLKFLNNLNGSAICGKLYKRNKVKDKKFLKLSIGEDALFNLNYIKENNKIVTLDKNYYYYRCNPNSLTNSLRKDLLDELNEVLNELSKEDEYIFFTYRIYQEYLFNLYLSNSKLLKKGIYKIKDYKNICNYLSYDINGFVNNFTFPKKVYFKIINFAVKHNMYCLIYIVEKLKLGIKYGKKRNK